MSIKAQRRMARGRGTEGFLLTETLATFAISAFLLVGLASLGPLLFNAVERSITNVQNADDLGRSLAAIRRDLSGLTRARWNGYEPQPFVFRGGPNSLFFAHREVGLDGLSDVRVVALREIVVAGKPRLTKSDAHLAAGALSFDDLRFGPPRDIPTGPARLRFWYVPATPNATRQRSWRVGPVLPQSVEIEAIDAVTTKVIARIRVPIHANADIGCLSGAGAGANVQAGDPPPPVAVGAPPPPPPVDPAAAGPTAATPAKDTGAFCGRTDAKDQTSSDPAAPPKPPELPL